MDAAQYRKVEPVTLRDLGSDVIAFPRTQKSGFLRTNSGPFAGSESDLPSENLGLYPSVQTT